MPSTMQHYTQLATLAAKQITGSYRDWTAFLTTAARLYKYPYHEQLMIYAQRPDAVACADFDLWNKTLRRYVRRGSKGIALIDDSGDTPRLRYVFDVSDTGGRENSRRPFLWELHAEHADAVAVTLENSFAVSGADGIDRQLEVIAAQLADEYWNDHKRDLLDIVDGSFLEDYDEFNIGVQFRNAATVSITYSLMSRCGLEPDEYFEHEDFLSIFDFNTPAAMSFLGTAVSNANQQVLRQIEITIKNYERSKAHEQPHLQPERGLSDSRPDTDGEQPALGQIRQDAEVLSQGASDGDLQSSSAVGQTDGTPDRDRPDSDPALGTDDAEPDGGAEREREPESQRPDEMGGADEQPESAGRGNDTDRVNLQLSFFPTEAEQISLIDEAESILPSAFSVSQADIDAELRRGSGYEDGKLRIYAAFQRSTGQKERVSFLKGEYNYYGHSHTYLDGSGGFVDYSPGKGMELSTGSYKDKVTISYTKMANRLAELIAADKYLTADEKTRYAELERDYAGLGGVPTPHPRMGFPAPPPASELEAVADVTPRSMTQDDVDATIQAWNGDIKSKHTVARHMRTHARDRDTAAFLQNEYGGDLAALRGKVFCGCCRHAMARMYKNPAFSCQYSRHHEHLDCRLQSVLESELEQVVYTIAEKQAQVILGIDSFADMSKLDIHLGQRAEYEKKLYALRNEKRRLYEEYLSGKITLEGYKTQKVVYDRDLGQLEQIFAKLSGDIELMQFSSSENKKVRAIASDVTGAGQLTRDLAELLIDKIYVYPDNRIEIDWAITGFAGVKDGGMQIAV